MATQCGCWDVIEGRDTRGYYTVSGTVRSTDRTILDGVSGQSCFGCGRTRLAAYRDAGLADDVDDLPCQD